MRRAAIAAVLILGLAVSGGALWRLSLERAEERRVREELLSELMPVTLANCTPARFGSPGNAYIMCGNLLDEAETAYSYGIAGEDSWGCEMARQHQVPVHQYDCFDGTRPSCEGANTIFHDECVEGGRKTVESRSYDTVGSQILRNGDGQKRIVMKMDVEGAEWPSLMATPDAALARIDQLALEFHGTGYPEAVGVVRKLKRTFFIVHLHFNNYACTGREPPFPASVFQVSFVNKRLGVRDPSAPPPVLPSPLDAPDNPGAPDCQLPAAH